MTEMGAKRNVSLWPGVGRKRTVRFLAPRRETRHSARSRTNLLRGQSTGGVRLDEAITEATARKRKGRDFIIDRRASHGDVRYRRLDGDRISRSLSLNHHL